MFGVEYYPTPEHVITEMLYGEEIEGKVILEPSAGSGHIVDHLNSMGAKSVLACEIDSMFRRYLQDKCTLLGLDFLDITSDQVSHIDLIVMNPPFSKADQHILHAYEIAPPGCRIVTLINSDNLKSLYSERRKLLSNLIDGHGITKDLGKCFRDSDRQTDVEVTLIRLQKPKVETADEFEGFYMDEDPEEDNRTARIMTYNVIRDIVNRYVQCIKIYDEQLNAAVRLNEMAGEFFPSDIGFQITVKREVIERNEFKKSLQKAGWRYVINKANLETHNTRKLREEINNFVERQVTVPFTMRNIYRMIDMILQTADQRMNSTILDVFEKMTSHAAENKYGLEGWKTNSHYLLCKRFILPYIFSVGWSNQVETSCTNKNYDLLTDFIRVLCFLKGLDYGRHALSLDEAISNRHFLKNAKGEYLPTLYGSHKGNNDLAQVQSSKAEREKDGEYGLTIESTDTWAWNRWSNWNFFKIKPYKKGTAHIEFKDENLWVLFNQTVAKLKGYPLPEKKEQTKYQDRQAGRKDVEPMIRKNRGGSGEAKAHTKMNVIHSFKI